MASTKQHHPVFFLQIPIAILMVVAILYLAKTVVVPLVVAVLLTFILTPIVILLQRWGLRRAYSVTITVLLALALFGVVGYIVGSQIHSLATELPNHRKEIEEKLAAIRVEGGAIADVLQMFRELGRTDLDKHIDPNQNPTPAKEVIITRPEEPSSAETIFQAVVPIIEPLANVGFVIILVIFMLFHREDLRNRVIGLLGDGRLTGTTRVIVDSAHRLSRFLLTQGLINVAFGVFFTIGLYFMNVEYAILWGFVTALLRFVPYIGTWLSVLLPLTLSFATSATWAQPVALLIYFGILDVITANAVEPLILGHHTGVSPIALLVAAVFWTWLWGPMGLVLSTPLTVCLVVIGQHVPRLRFFALLLGDQPALEPQVHFYQRLLARDEVEALEVAVEYANAEGLEKVYDNVLLPALAMARHDRRDAGLNAEDEEFIIRSTREILAAIESRVTMEKVDSETVDQAANISDEPAVPDAADEQSQRRVLILGCPAHQQAEELSLQMLAQLLKPKGCDVEVISTRAMPAEIEAQIVEAKPALVFIAIVPPGGLVQARFLCKRLRRRFADLSIVVGHWGDVADFDRLFRQIRSSGGNYVATTLLQARAQIEALIQPPTTSETQTEAVVDAKNLNRRQQASKMVQTM